MTTIAKSASYIGFLSVKIVNQITFLRKFSQSKLRSRTLMAVHTAILDDLVYPAEIVGKRIR